jgi:hypothetical protein
MQQHYWQGAVHFGQHHPGCCCRLAGCWLFVTPVKDQVRSSAGFAGACCALHSCADALYSRHACITASSSCTARADCQSGCSKHIASCRRWSSMRLGWRMHAYVHSNSTVQSLLCLPQGNCGSCVAFGTTVLTEFVLMRREFLAAANSTAGNNTAQAPKVRPDLSEADLMQCHRELRCGWLL